MIGRSTQVRLTNQTPYTLILTQATLTQGAWSADQLPPRAIAAGRTGVWQSEAVCFADGTAGAVCYSAVLFPPSGSPEETISIAWSNPFSGVSTYQADATASTVLGEGVRGFNASVTFTLSR